MMKSVGFFLAATVCYLAGSPTRAFHLPPVAVAAAPVPPPRTIMASSATANTDAASSTDNERENDAPKPYLYVPSERDARYQGNMAQYLLDLHDVSSTFDFCGGMMFQLVLSDKLRSHLETVAASESTDDQPVVHPASQPVMSRTPDYQKTARADNVSVFHGRELRQIPSANGGMGFVLQLSYADPAGVAAAADGPAAAGKGADAAWTGAAVDPQGWSAEEIATYDGWRGDSFRQWRKAAAYEAEGFATFAERFGTDAFGLNHRFFLHLDDSSRVWLSAEDGCEGTPSEGRSLLGKLGGMLFGK